jgi:hypothetical protein
VLAFSQQSDTTPASMSIGAVRISNASMNFCQTTQRHIPEDDNPHSLCRQNLRRLSELFVSLTFEENIVYSRNKTQPMSQFAD